MIFNCSENLKEMTIFKILNSNFYFCCPRRNGNWFFENLQRFWLFNIMWIHLDRTFALRINKLRVPKSVSDVSVELECDYDLEGENLPLNGTKVDVRYILILATINHSNLKLN